MYATVFGRPGISNNRIGNYRNIFRDGRFDLLSQSGGLVIDATKCRDPFHARPTELRPGLLLGQITATKKLANSFVGVLGASATAGTTALTLSASKSPGGAAEIVRRIGATGTMKLIGPPTAGGTVATETVTYTSVDVVNGLIQVTATTAAFVSGSLLATNDGSETPVTFIPDGLGHVLTEASPVDLDFPGAPTRGIVDVENFLPWPTDTAAKNAIRLSLQSTGASFFWSDRLSPV